MRVEAPGTSLEVALAEIAAEAAALDREPAFPGEAFSHLREAGALAATLPDAEGKRPPVAGEWGLVRRVAAADGSVGRIFDGHLNAVERLQLAAPPALRDSVLARVRDGRALLGVWGADPGPGEGEPARLRAAEPGPLGGGGEGSRRLDGVKTFCSGAGGLDGALVMVGSDEGDPPSLVHAELDESVEIDRSWYRGSGLRASESHRVIFHRTPVTVLGEPGELGREPWFSRDAMRTATSWAGMADCAAKAAIADLAERRRGDRLAELAAGRITAARGTIDLWLAEGAAAAERDEPLKDLSVALRVEIRNSVTTILGEAAAACGSAPFATGTALDRSRRDLELFLLQHRLDPLAAKAGARALDGTAAARPS